MDKVTSADGTAIAYDRAGEGHPVVIVGGATCDRLITRPLADALAAHFDVINYDRRGRGDSTDTPPFAVGREVDDLAALIAAAGGSAHVYGHSSGAALALHAAARGLPIDRLVLHEPPFNPDDARRMAESRRLAGEIDTAVAEGRRGDVLAMFLGGVGMPPEMLQQVREDPRMLALAHTVAYDLAALGVHDRGGTVPAELAATVAVPTLVLAGGASPDWMIDTARRLADALRAGRHEVLDGQDHIVPPEILVPALRTFLQATG
ncbi:alpha/beta hydrolase [Spirillospora sp. NPDC048819]|uniref:alpha/beta fold hydrolase n=1 Tax=Spirillospora sp. NPDC048819 TaxID=3155268 RepID=UPI0033D1AA81